MRRIENWSLVAGQFHSIQSPEDARTSLFGEVYDHELKGKYHRFDDGEKSITSKVIGIELPDVIQVLSGSKYVLGNPTAEYEREYPDARKRLMERLSKCQL